MAESAALIRQAAASIATRTATIHGGTWQVQIDHMSGFVFVMRA
jgi:hypothetical protein